MLKNTIFQQKAERQRLESLGYVQRDVLRDAQAQLPSPLIKVVTGPRRAGKSVLAILMLKGKKYGYLNCDDEEILKLIHLDPLIEALLAEEGHVEFLFFDEIQNLKGWELFVSKLHRRGYNLILSGSNARLFSGELATALTGRYVPIEVLPFGFHEYLIARGATVSEENLKLAEGKGVLLNHLSTYLKEGGYPEVVTHNLSAHDYMRTLAEAIFFKDVVKRYKIRTPADIYNLALYLMSNACSEYTFNSLTKTLQLRSVKTVQKYVGFLEETNLFYSLNRFSPKLKTQMRVPRKIYLVDNGLLDAGAFAISVNWNRQLENAVFVELVRRKYRPNIDLFYYRTKKRDREVDFLVRDGIHPKMLIQVCYQAEDLKTMARETSALVEAARETGCKDLQVVTYNQETTETLDGFQINFIPAWRFLLKEILPTNPGDIKAGGIGTPGKKLLNFLPPKHRINA